MFDSQFRLSPDLLSNGTTSDDSSSNGPWPQMSLDRLLEHHDIKPAEPISISHSSNNDYLSSSAQFKEFFNNYHQQYQQQNQPLDIASLLSSSPPQQQQQQQQYSAHIPDNYMFEPQTDVQPLVFGQYIPDHNQISMRQDTFHQQQSQPYMNRSQQPINIPRHQQHHRFPPVLHIPTEDHYQQQQQNPSSRFKSNPPPAYIACLNHGINYNGVSGPPILLPPSF